MIDFKQAISTAKAKAEEMLEKTPLQLEEVEREEYKGKDVWSITLSFLKDSRKLREGSVVAALESLYGTKDVEYKRFLIDVESGELVAMKLREVVS